MRYLDCKSNREHKPRSKKMVEFEKNTEGTKQFATFLAQLVKEGVTYEVDNSKDKYSVTLTGGF